MFNGCYCHSCQPDYNGDILLPQIEEENKAKCVFDAWETPVFYSTHSCLYIESAFTQLDYLLNLQNYIVNKGQKQTIAYFLPFHLTNMHHVGK